MYDPITPKQTATLNPRYAKLARLLYRGRFDFTQEEYSLAARIAHGIFVLADSAGNEIPMKEKWIESRKAAENPQAISFPESAVVQIAV